MSPQNKNKENQSLPSRWRFRSNAYWYRVPKDKRAYWDNKTEFRLGSSLSEAHKVFAERVQQYTGIDGRILTMAQMLDRYLVEITPGKAARTQRDEPKMLATLKSVFGNSGPSSIKASDIYTIYDAMKLKRGLTTANRHMELLSHVFSMGLRWGCVSHHPMLNKQFQKEQPVIESRYVEDWEILEALKVAPALIIGYINLKWVTGLRQTDLLSLTEHQIKNGFISIRPSKTRRHNNPGIEIEITPELSDIISYIKANRKVASIYLFCTRKGQPYIKPDKSCNGFQSIWQRWMKKALSETDLEVRFSERQIRAKTGTDVANADSVAAARELLGHSDERVTRKHYLKKPVRVKPLNRN